MTRPEAAELVDLLEEEHDLRERFGFHPRCAEIAIRTTELVGVLSGRTT